MSSIEDTNWKITRTGAFTAIIISIFYLYLVLDQTSFNYALLLAMASGTFYAISSKINDLKKYHTITKPLSGFLAMASATLLIGSIGFLFTGSTGAIFSTFSGENIISSIKTVILSLIGLIGLIIGAYLTTKGSTLLSFDKIDSKTPLGPGRSDFIFGVILTAITLLSIFGTALINDISISDLLSSLEQIFISSEAFSGVITSFLIILSYLAFRKAWRKLPISESIPEKYLEQYRSASRIENIIGWAMIPLLVFALAMRDLTEVKGLEVLGLIEASSSRQILVEVFFISLLIIAAVKLIQFFTGDRGTLKSLGPYVVFGLVAWIISPVLIPLMENLISLAPDAFATIVESFISDIGDRNSVLLLLTLASWISFGLKSLMGTLRAFGLVPSGLEGITLTSIGLFFTSVGFFIYQEVPSSTMLFLGVALSMVVWEIGKRSTVLGMEIGHKGESRQAELVQIASKLLFAIGAVILARTALIFLQQFQLSTDNFTGLIFLLSAVGITFLIFSLKDHT